MEKSVSEGLLSQKRLSSVIFLIEKYEQKTLPPIR